MGGEEGFVSAGRIEEHNIGYFARFGVDWEVARRVLSEALGRGGDFADLFVQHREGQSLALEDGEVNRASTSVDLGAGVRVVRGEQTGYAYTEELTPESLRQAARTAAAIASGPASTSATTCQVVSHADFYRMEKSLDSVSIPSKRDMLERMHAQGFAESPHIRKVTAAFSGGVERVLVVDSDGRWAEDFRPLVMVACSCVAEREGRKEAYGESRSFRAGMEALDPEMVRALVKDVVKRTIRLFEAIQPPPGQMPVVLAAGSSGILLHEAIGHGMEADFNRKQVSIYTEKMNRTIAKPFVSIVDDATVPRFRGALNVDDEGVPGQKTMLVENGVLRSYLHDRMSARHYGCAPTGNGRRQSFRYKPLPRMRCTYMLPGPDDPEEIVRSVERGLYAESFANGQVQIGAGDFSFYVKSGYLIEGGKLTRPIKDANIIGNGPEILERVERVGNDLVLDNGGWACGKEGQSVPVTQGLPTVKISSITVGGARSSGGSHG